MATAKEKKEDTKAKKTTKKTPKKPPAKKPAIKTAKKAPKQPKNTKKPKSKRGRPKIYDKKWADSVANKIPKMMKEGKSIAEVCLSMRISKDTFYKARLISDEFSDAVKKGVTYSEAFWMEMGQDAACGDLMELNSIIWIFNVKNRFGWRSEGKTLQGVDFAKCETAVEKMQRLVDLCATELLTIEDAIQYRDLIKSVVDEEIIATLNRIRKLEDPAIRVDSVES